MKTRRMVRTSKNQLWSEVVTEHTIETPLDLAKLIERSHNARKAAERILRGIEADAINVLKKAGLPARAGYYSALPDGKFTAAKKPYTKAVYKWPYLPLEPDTLPALAIEMLSRIDHVKVACKTDADWLIASRALHMLKPYHRIITEFSTVGRLNSIRQSKAGLRSAAKRQAGRTWTSTAERLALSLRNTNPTLSQDRLATLILERWPTGDTQEPEHRSLLRLISGLERSGTLARRRR